MSNCPNCQSTEFEIYLSSCTDIFYKVNGVWDLLKCGNCDLVYTSNYQSLASELYKLYPNNYSAFNLIPNSGRSSVRSFFKNILACPYYIRYGSINWMPKKFKTGAVLDLGCGVGSNLMKFNPDYWDCYGIDLSLKAIEIAKKYNSEATFIVGELLKTNLDKKFDLIIMSHILEHTPYPNEALLWVRSHLKESGQLFISVPNINSCEFHFFKRNWKGLDLPRHLIHFDKSVLEKILEECGFKVITIRPAMFATSISESIIGIFPEKLKYSFLRTRLGHILYLICIPIASFSYLLGNDGIIELVVEIKD